VIAVDVNPAKEAWARKFGATEFVNPSQLPDGKRIQDHLVEITDGGLDFTFDATGNVSCATGHHAVPLTVWSF
jgi:S-(hydroxymethyl)glutathione dehydrogenase/alcohol dehydrogenase